MIVVSHGWNRYWQDGQVRYHTYVEGAEDQPDCVCGWAEDCYREPEAMVQHLLEVIDSLEERLGDVDS